MKFSWSIVRSIALLFGACLLVPCCASKKRTIKGGATEIAPLVDRFSQERKAFSLTNEFRKSQGKQPQVWDEELEQLAREHAVYMASCGRLSHDNFTEQRFKRMKNCSCGAENVGSNKGYSDPAATVVDGWKHSSGHRKNMLGDFERTAIAVARGRDGTWYFTQLFAKSVKRRTY